MDEKISRRQALEQLRAKSAWEAVSKVENGEKADYKARAKDLPAMIQINGLGSTMAFLLSKPKKKAYKRLYDHVSQWVTQQIYGKKPGNEALMDFIRNEDVTLYRQATAEAIEYGIWLKRYVESWEDVKASDE